jgi:hypothetical protein
MFRSLIASGIVVVVLASAFVTAAPVPAEEKAKEAARTPQAVRAKLASPAAVDEIGAGTPLKEAMQFLAERFEVTIAIDVDAFKTDLGIQDVDNQPVKLAKMNNVRLDTVLRLLVQQTGGDFFISNDGVIWIMPKDTLVSRILAQTVTVNFEKKPLDEALKQLAQQSGLSIVLDQRRAGDNARTQVTADLRNVNLDDALRIVADMAELKAVVVGRAVYVTTAENAKVIKEELEQKRQEEEKRKENPNAGA